MKHIKTFEEFINESKLNEEVYKMSHNDFRKRISELKDDYMEDFWSPGITTILTQIKNEDNSVKGILTDKISKIKDKFKKETDKNKKELYKMQIVFLQKISQLKKDNIDYEKIADDLESIAQQKESLKPEE